MFDAVLRLDLAVAERWWASAGAKEELAELEAIVAAHCVVVERWRGQRGRQGLC